MGTCSFELGYTPPSLNRSRGGNQGRASVMKQNRLKRQLQTDLGMMLLTTDLPRGCSRITATATLRFPVRRTRDEGNHAWLLDKALADALVEAGYLPDDDPAHYRFEGLLFELELGPRRTLVVLTFR